MSRIAALVLAAATAIGFYLARRRRAHAQLVADALAVSSASREAVATRMALVASSTQSAVAIWGLDGTVEWINASFTKLTGYTSGDVIGCTIPELLHGPKTDPTAYERIMEAITAGEPFVGEILNYTKSRREIWVSVEVNPIRAEDGQVIGYAGAARDITRERQARQLDKDRGSILEMISAREPVDVVLGRVSEMIEQFSPCLRAWVMLLRDGRLARVAGSAALPADFLAALDEHALHLARHLCSAAAEAEGDGQVASSDLANDPCWADLREQGAAHGLKSCRLARILSGAGDVLGTMALFSTESGTPDSAEREVLLLASRLAAVAVEHDHLDERLIHRAHHDALTSLPNRGLLEERLEQAMSRARRNNRTVGLMFLDIDDFKLINDSMGHQLGDDLLRGFAQRVGCAIGPDDVLARMGGDEFIIALPDLTDGRQPANTAQRVLDALREPFNLAGKELYLSTSIGITLFPQDAQDVPSLEKSADAAMYRAKQLGRSNFQFFSPELNATAMERLEMAGELRRALEEKQFELHYQPQIDPAGKLIGFEALLRWRHPAKGLVPPLNFIPVAEETGLIVPIGDWVLHEACRQNRAWQLAGFPAVCMAVNVSALQFARPDFPAAVRRVLDETGLEPKWLELELTESLLMQHTKDAVAMLQSLRDAGVELAIDDFGTGYSSLSYLKQLPVGTLKVDRSFVREIVRPEQANSKDTAIVRAIVSLAHNLGMRIVAEGTETVPQRDLLCAIGCDVLQGYLYSPPRPAQDAAAAFAKFTGSTSAAA